MTRETMEFDVVIVGAGPAGLSAAIKLAKLAVSEQKPITICVLEKAAQVGNHILSGNVFETRALDELLPDWRHDNAPIHCKATEDQFMFLTRTRAWRMPTPPPMNNKGNYIISLGLLCQWLADQAEQLGVAIFPGFSAATLLYENDSVVGVGTGDMGVDKKGQPTDRFQAGVDIRAKQIMLAEGCHGSLSKEVIHKYDLRAGKSPQTYALGIKELWEVEPTHHQEGMIMHTIGWPLDQFTYGGSFLYHWDQQRVCVGLVVGLDYQNPYLDPFEELQQFKKHPKIKPLFESGKRIAYGARALIEGGIQSLPKLSFPGGVLIGDSAGTLNVPKIKGTHTAMQSGMLAAQAVFEQLQTGEMTECKRYQTLFDQSWVADELQSVRNIRPGFKYGLYAGLVNSAIDTYILRGKAPWTFKNHADHKSLKPAKNVSKINYPKPDGKISFDKLSSVYLANINQSENQPCHLQLSDPAIAVSVNHKMYDSPETRYCPANVYEFVTTDNNPRLVINASNCVHCKTCDIKDPMQNIHWVPPEGGGGPTYGEM